MSLLTGITAAVVLGPRVARGGDHTNLEEHLPVTITDARPTPYLGSELQGAFRYQRDRTGANVLWAEPRLEVGFPRNAQLTLKAPGTWRIDERAELGRVTGEVFYNLNQQTLILPMLAFAVAVEAPTERHTAGWDPEFRVFLTKNVPGSAYYHALHLNGAYQHNFARLAEERSGRYRFAVGYGMRLSTSFLGLISFVREQKMLYRWYENILEAGARYQANHLLVLSFGGGVGIGEQSPLLRVTFGIQHRLF